MKPVRAWAIKTKRGTLARGTGTLSGKKIIIIKVHSKDLEPLLDEGETIVRVIITEVEKEPK